MPWISEERCAGCGLCIRECPAGAIAMVGRVATIDEGQCIRCGKCHDICPAEAARHDGERLPLLVVANQNRVERLLAHYGTAKERGQLLTRLVRYFHNQERVAAETVAWIANNACALSGEQEGRVSRGQSTLAAAECSNGKT